MLRITYKGEQLAIPYNKVAYVDIDAYEAIEKEFIQLQAEYNRLSLSFGLIDDENEKLQIENEQLRKTGASLL